MSSLKVKRGNVYKVAYIGKRKDAKRHLVESFQAESLDEAIKRFIDIVYDKGETGVRFELLTGNWKLITYTTGVYDAATGEIKNYLT